MIVVSDSGPLIALAKIEGINLLSRLYSHILTSPIVYEETVISGLHLSQTDAILLEEEYKIGHLIIREPTLTTLPILAGIGAGEEQSIRLAISVSADILLIDDLVARQAAEANLLATGTITKVKGTLGVIVVAYQRKEITSMRAIEMIENAKSHPGIWLKAELCDRVIEIIKTTPLN